MDPAIRFALFVVMCLCMWWVLSLRHDDDDKR